MREGIQLRWIAEAEAKWFRDFALAQRAASEPYLRIVPAHAGPAWFDRLRAMMPTLVRTGASRRSVLEGGSPISRPRREGPRPCSCGGARRSPT
jgi:hypothetical protein